MRTFLFQMSQILILACYLYNNIVVWAISEQILLSLAQTVLIIRIRTLSAWHFSELLSTQLPMNKSAIFILTPIFKSHQTKKNTAE